MKSSSQNPCGEVPLIKRPKAFRFTVIQVDNKPIPLFFPLAECDGEHTVLRRLEKGFESLRKSLGEYPHIEVESPVFNNNVQEKEKK